MKKWTREEARRANALASQIIDAAIEVQSIMGDGLLESAYERCLCRELALRDIPFRRQVPVAVEYKSCKLGTGFRANLIVNGLLVVELKVARRLTDGDVRQARTYLRHSGGALALLLNYGARLASGGIRRMIDPASWPDELPFAPVESYLRPPRLPSR